MAITRLKKSSKGYNYKYTELATIHEELEKQGIAYKQEVKYNAEAGADYIWTTLFINDEWQEPLCGCRVITGELSGGNSAQEQGSALTYARRYSLLMALGWATEDDDAQSLGSAKPQAKTNYQAGSEAPASFKQKDYLKTLLRGSKSEEEIKRILDNIKTSAQASAAIKKAQALHDDYKKNDLQKYVMKKETEDVVPTEEEWKQIN